MIKCLIFCFISYANDVAFNSYSNDAHLCFPMLRDEIEIWRNILETVSMLFQRVVILKGLANLLCTI
jgi:hypothetical protein